MERPNEERFRHINADRSSYPRGSSSVKQLPRPSSLVR
jgi:hypothetical protein